MFKPRRILVPVALTRDAERIVRQAADLARLTDGRLRLFHVFDVRALEDVYNLHGLGEDEARSRMRANAEEWMKKLRGRKWLAGVRVDHAFAEGLPQEEIVRAATEWKAQLVVLRRRRRGGLVQLLYGRTSESVVQDAPCAVLVLPS